MPLFLTIFDGPTPAEARPLLTTRDPDAIAVVRNFLMKRITEELAKEFRSADEVLLEQIQEEDGWEE